MTSRRLAAPAPDRPSTRRDEGLESEIHTLCCEWSAWAETRHRFGAPRLNPGSSIEQFNRVPSSAGDERSGRCSRDVALFNWCVIHHEDQIARKVFESHFLKRGRINVKRQAFEFGISRRSWYRVVNDFARSSYRRFEMLANAVDDGVPDFWHNKPL